MDDMLEVVKSISEASRRSVEIEICLDGRHAELPCQIPRESTFACSVDSVQRNYEPASWSKGFSDRVT